MTRIYTVTVRENIVKGKQKVGETARQESVKADSVSDAEKKVLAAVKKAQPAHAENHEVIAVVLTHEVADD